MRASEAINQKYARYSASRCMHTRRAWQHILTRLRGGGSVGGGGKRRPNNLQLSRCKNLPSALFSSCDINSSAKVFRHILRYFILPVGIYEDDIHCNNFHLLFISWNAQFLSLFIFFYFLYFNWFRNCTFSVTSGVSSYSMLKWKFADGNSQLPRISQSDWNIYFFCFLKFFEFTFVTFYFILFCYFFHILRLCITL